MNDYHETAAKQAERSRMLIGWTRRAENLLREYWRTGSLAHMAAFERHVVGMRRRLFADQIGRLP